MRDRVIRNLRRHKAPAMHTMLAALFSLSGMLMIIYGATSATLLAVPYSHGAYGTCQYGSCSVSIASNGSVNLSMMLSTQHPTLCSTGKDTVTVSTRSSTGYTVTVGTPTADTNLVGTVHGLTIPAMTATVASPSILSGNTWGYRVDAGVFGSGPTIPISAGPIPATTFAKVPAATTPSYVTSSNAPATDAATDIWYGVCVQDTTIKVDTYTNDVVYTATINP